MTIVVLVAGQSNAQGTTGATNGDATIQPGVKVWNSQAMGNGTAWADAAYGVKPFNIGNSPWSRSIGIGFANELRRLARCDVYVIVKAEGGRRIETFLKPATLSANGWSAGTDNSVYLYPDIANAIAVIPGTSKTKLDYILWQQGEANEAVDDATSYAAKLTALVGDLTAEGVYDADVTKMFCGGLIPGHAWRTVHKNAVLTAGLGYVHGDGLPDQGDGLHYTGDGLMRLGARYARSIWMLGNGIFTGDGSPEYAHSGSPGARYLNSTGGAGTTLFVKESGAGNTGWVGK